MSARMPRWLSFGTSVVVPLAAGIVGCTSSVTVVDGRSGQVVPVSVDADEDVTPEVPRGRRRKRAGEWTVQSAGPRMGMVYVGGDAGEKLEAAGLDPLLTAWGWQWEYQYESVEGGPTGLVEIVPLVAGLEQGQAMPVANVLFGLRTADGKEFAMGPNISQSGVGLTLAVGKTYKVGPMSLPVNFAVVSNGEGLRGSVTFGWNLRQ